jgi:Flp pilus assembly protein TadB
MARKSPTQLANAALDAIAKHEKECSERWRECTYELKALSHQVKAHSARWEKLAWIIISTLIVALVTALLKTFF